MIISIHPPLEGLLAQRFIALAKQLERKQTRRLPSEFEELCEKEVNWCQNHPHLDGNRETYEAAARVLIDLARLSWTIHQQNYSIELHSPVSRPDRHDASPEEITQHKETVRQELRPLQEAQFRDSSVRDFIRKMETPSRKTGCKSILNLIADGKELYARLQPAQVKTGAERNRILSKAVRPYLQLVEPDAKDEYTGLRLSAIWRYFRYTWTIPQRAIPGRQLLYLVRDAAHPYHAIMGIASLNNCAMQMKERDNHIGWTFDAWSEQVLTAVKEEDAKERLTQLHKKLEANIDRGLTDIELSGLATLKEIENPTPELIARLRRKSEVFAKLREEALKELSTDYNQPFVLQEIESNGEPAPPVANELLELERTRKLNNKQLVKSRQMLIAKKRAFELARRLQSRSQLRDSKDQFLNPETAPNLLLQEEFITALNTALLTQKSTRVGTNMLEITTCGAIRPYNPILGGKLTALLLLSPQVADDYQRRYGDEPSIISSQLKNAPLVRDSTLVYLGTTSLYALGSSQYDRLRLHTGIIAPDQKEIRYKKIGYTSGYGTVQFSPETVRAVNTILEKELGYQNVNSIFGEGPSPRLRKLRAGLELLGFDPEALMRHNQYRIIYSIVLAEQSRDYLCGESVDLPEYIRLPSKYRDATKRIADFWIQRWLSSRLNHLPSIRKLSSIDQWRLSEEIPIEKPEPVESKSSSSAKPSNALTSISNSNDEVDFWRSFASAGLNVCSDELDEDDINRLHVERPLEEFLLNKVRDGFSIILTGNAGDGKTHVLRRLKTRLEEIGAIVQPDATAAMRQGDITPIIEEWRGALAKGKPYCLAANEYPLFELRTKGQDDIPLLREVDRQCRQRLAYGSESESENALENVLVVDLSLRNPLIDSFSGALLDRLLHNPALINLANGDNDLNFTRNFKRLKDSRVRNRILALFDRLVTRGYRASIRELWILLTRLLFSSTPLIRKNPLSPDAWYSERLFEKDDRFILSSLLHEHCDPAYCSHPQWDALLEHPGSTNPADWAVDNIEPISSLGKNVIARFNAMKRAFYFEHTHGEQAFALDDDPARDFKQLIIEAENPDETLKKELIEKINLCYCAKRFNGMRDAMYLWIGHRFHELPTRSYIANQSIHTTQFDVLIPRLPRRVAGGLDFKPDHVLLRYKNNDRTISLRVDYSMYRTLSLIRSGLPRHLVSEREINSLDTFIEELQSSEISQSREFITFNAQHRQVMKARLSSDFKKYSEVKAP